jgi:histidyl-tRNA synthetase
MAKGLFQAIRGMKDILPSEAALWQRLEETCLNHAHKYGYELIRTPMVEMRELFVRSVGEQTDVVTKEMYTFEDRNGQDCVLRPEGTAACVRAGIEHGLLYNQVRRLCYLGPMFRRERPQKGRYRQFHTFGAESFGVDSPTQDVELILLGQAIFKTLGVDEKIVCHINCLGDKQAQRDFSDALRNYFSPYVSTLDADVAVRLEKNPLRVCDSKDEAVIALLKNAPKISDFLNDASRRHFERVQILLKQSGIRFELAPGLVRGLDYYSEVVFEWLASEGLGAQGAVGGGGRYNQLVEVLGGHSTPAAGFGLGLERLLMLMPQETVSTVSDVYLMVMKEDHTGMAMAMAQALRQNLNLSVVMDHSLASQKAQYKKAEQSGAHFFITIDEGGVIQLKDRLSGKTLLCDQNQLMTHLRQAKSTQTSSE